MKSIIKFTMLLPVVFWMAACSPDDDPKETQKPSISLLSSSPTANESEEGEQYIKLKHHKS
ncbi:MAG: hypothetical protein HC917_13305 [Richelia sp. SM2_1_7]|nr:hypothetical protein [Richelia sp. SM2_1_7]